MSDKRIPPCSGHAFSNTVKCECCESIIDLDDTDWCDKCDRSIFDDSPCRKEDLCQYSDLPSPLAYDRDYMYKWIRQKSGK